MNPTLLESDDAWHQLDTLSRETLRPLRISPDGFENRGDIGVTLPPFPSIFGRMGLTSSRGNGLRQDRSFGTDSEGAFRPGIEMPG